MLPAKSLVDKQLSTYQETLWPHSLWLTIFALFAKLRRTWPLRRFRSLARGTSGDIGVVPICGASFWPADRPQLAAASPSAEEQIAAI